MNREQKIAIVGIALAVAGFAMSCTWAVRTNDIATERKQRIAELKTTVELYRDKLDNAYARIEEVEAVLEQINKERAGTEYEIWQ